MRFDWWTLGLQAVNVLVLLWLLKRFLFGPVKAIVAARRAAAEKLLDDAAHARDEAQATAAAMDAQRRELAARDDALLADARTAAAAERAVLMERAAADAKKLDAETRTRLDREREAQRRDLEAQAAQLAVAMAGRLLALLPPERVTEALLDGLAQDLAALPEPARRDLAAGSPVSVTTATPLAVAEQAAWQKRLAGIAGDGLSIAFADDPALIAGVELRGPHTLIRRHWQADLERLSRSLSTVSRGADASQLA